jgi:hypothetical protein
MRNKKLTAIAIFFCLLLAEQVRAEYAPLEERVNKWLQSNNDEGNLRSASGGSIGDGTDDTPSCELGGPQAPVGSALWLTIVLGVGYGFMQKRHHIEIDHILLNTGTREDFIE